MGEKFFVTLKYENGNKEVITVTSNYKDNLISKLASSNWIKCEETERIFNMNKVYWFQVTEVG